MSLESYLDKILKKEKASKTADIVFFVISIVSFWLAFICTAVTVPNFSSYFVDSFKQFIVFSSDMVRFIPLIMCYVLIVFFIVASIICLVHKDKKRLKLRDIILFIFGILGSVIFIHGANEFSIIGFAKEALNFFNNGKIGFGVFSLLSFIFAIVFVLFTIIYAIKRISYKVRHMTLSIILQEIPFSSIALKDEKVLNEIKIKKDIHKLVFKYNKDVTKEVVVTKFENFFEALKKQIPMYNPNIAVQIKCWNLTYFKGFKRFKNYRVSYFSGKYYVTLVKGREFDD